MKYLEVCLQTSIFAPLFNRKHISLDYGVMVAQQVLVLFVQVRILVVQRRKALEDTSFRAFLFLLFLLLFVKRHNLGQSENLDIIILISVIVCLL